MLDVIFSKNFVSISILAFSNKQQQKQHKLYKRNTQNFIDELHQKRIISSSVLVEALFLCNFRDDLNNFKDLDRLKCESGHMSLDTKENVVLNLLGHPELEPIICPKDYLVTGKTAK